MSAYTHLDNLIGAYFNQDAEYIADTLEGIVADYVDGHAPERQAALRREIAAFLVDHGSNVDAAFEHRYGFDVDPTLWDHPDAASFLRAIDDALGA